MNIEYLLTAPAATARASRPCICTGKTRSDGCSGIAQIFVQGCLPPVGRLHAGHTFRAARRRPLDQVVALNRWDGPPLANIL